MGITRRQFLKWSGVSAVGAVAFNGCLIPEQELQIESPVFLPEDLVSGIDNWYATLCRQDPEGCGIIIRVVEGRAKKVEGNPDYPLNQGKHHARSEAGLQALYHPDRISEPLAREGDAHVPISWEEARRRVADRMNGLSDRSRFLLVTQPLRGHQALLASEFVKAYGGRSMAYETLEQVTLRRAILEVFEQERIPAFDIENCKYLLSFGADFLSTWLSPVKFSRGYGELRQGSSHRGLHVQVDPALLHDGSERRRVGARQAGRRGRPGNEHGIRDNARRAGRLGGRERSHRGWRTRGPCGIQPGQPAGA